MGCPNGHSNEPGANFCSTCGARVESEWSAPTSPVLMSPAPVEDDDNGWPLSARRAAIFVVILIVLGVAAYISNHTWNSSSDTFASSGGTCSLGLQGENTQILFSGVSDSDCQKFAQQLSQSGEFWQLDPTPLNDPKTFCVMQSGSVTATVVDVQSAMGVFAGEACSGFQSSGWTQSQAG